MEPIGTIGTIVTVVSMILCPTATDRNGNKTHSDNGKNKQN